LRADQIERINGQLHEVFSLLREEMERFSSDPVVCKSYGCALGPSAEGTKPEPHLRILSPLALGADRLAASAALDHGYELYVPMPFSQAEYEKDFTGSGQGHDEEVQRTAAEDLAEFRDLLGRASAKFALDGSHFPEAPKGQAYEAVGRYVVRHNDLLIAIWDGGPGGGRGGTSDIVHYAAGAGVPVWWIDACEKDAPPVWLTDIQDLRDRRPAAKPPKEMLREYLEKLIRVPEWLRKDRDDSIGKLAHLFREEKLPPVEAYFTELPLPSRWYWKTYAWVMDWTCRGLKLPHRNRRPAPDDAAQRYWYTLQGPAADRAGEYSDRYRSSYILVILLATLALVFGATSVWLSSREFKGWLYWIGYVASAAELLAVLAPVALVAAAAAREWHARSIDYRILAELFRKQQTLAAVGWALPIGSVDHLGDMQGLAWVCWLFAAMQRAAPLPVGDLTQVNEREAGRAAVLALIDEQLEYHHDRKVKSTTASDVFEKYGRLTFKLIFACVFVKAFLEGLESLPAEVHRAGLTTRTVASWVLTFGLMATVLPGVSAAVVGLRSYAEWQMLNEQSHHMILLLEQARARVVRLNLARPSVSQDLGAEALAVANIMLQDLEGWGRLFRGKSPEM
jgi:hypothetical protein